MRRGICILVSVALAAAGCSQQASTEQQAASTTSTTTTTTVAQLDAPAPYVPIAGEPVAELKVMATEFLQAVGTYEKGGGNAEALATRLAGLPADPAVAVGRLLVPTAASAVEIVYPQLGGLTEDAASIMVVFTWRLLEDDRETSVVRTADVRLRREAGAWRVTGVESLGGEPTGSPEITPLAQAVLANDRLDLPDSARWDIQSGRIGDEILQVLQDLSQQHTLRVAVLASGHPHNVFESEYVSNHTEGRGVDIWAIDDTPVVSLRDPDGPLPALVQGLVAQGITEVGSPFDVDGPGGASFTNTVHQDHLHVAFDG